MEFSQVELTNGALSNTSKYLSQASLGQDEKLQLLSCAYAFLYLKAASNASMKELGEAHELIAKCFERLEDLSWAAKHRQTAAGYLRQNS